MDVIFSDGLRSAVGRTSDSRAIGPGFDTRSGHILSFLLPLTQEGQLSVTGESTGGLNQPRKSVYRLPDSPGMTIDVYRGLERIVNFFNAVNSSSQNL